MARKTVQTHNAPAAIGPYSQAIQVDSLVFISGQIPLDAHTMTLVSDAFADQAAQVIRNLQAMCEACGGTLNDIVKLTIYITDLQNFPLLNTIMTQFFSEPYPARATVEVSALPKNARIEMDAILSLR